VFLDVHVLIDVLVFPCFNMQVVLSFTMYGVPARATCGSVQGTAPSFGQFGKLGKVTGSVQRTTGKVSLQIQLKKFEARIAVNANVRLFVCAFTLEL
jgi:hypothetical protein